jgi:hypothetical protein
MEVKHMRRMILVAVFLLTSSVAMATDPQVVWVGGGAQVSNDDRPGYMADTMISLGSYNSATFFFNPMIILKHSKVGVDVGLGGRLPMFSGEMIGGLNAFFDYTNDQNHRRLGLGGELFHPKFSGHVNVYLPLSDQQGNEEALPGFDFAVGIPVPNASYISVWPGFYYYNGRHEDDLKGISLALQVRPVQALTFILGARNDTPSAGRDDSEIYARIELTIPMSRMGKDLWRFDRGKYPVDINSQMDRRVSRERFIAIEKRHD